MKRSQSIGRTVNERDRRPSNSRLSAVVLLSLLAPIIAGIMIETYWDCRLKARHAMRECLPPRGWRDRPRHLTNPTLR